MEFPGRKGNQRRLYYSKLECSQSITYTYTYTMKVNRAGEWAYVLHLRKSSCWSRLLVFLLIPLALTLFVPSSAAQGTPPNIIIILADDLGYGDVSFNGCPDYATPNIDSLAANGIWFSNGYVSQPVCSPSRAGLMMGRYHQWF